MCFYIKYIKYLDLDLWFYKIFNILKFVEIVPIFIIKLPKKSYFIIIFIYFHDNFKNFSDLSHIHEIYNP